MGKGTISTNLQEILESPTGREQLRQFFASGKSETVIVINDKRYTIKRSEWRKR